MSNPKPKKPGAFKFLENPTNAALGYVDGLELNRPQAQLHPNNCAVILRTADNRSVGGCWHYLRDGKCEVHGQVKPAKTE